jgi:hypothetical protein
MGLALGGVCGRSADGLEAFKEWSRGCPAKFDARDREKVYMSADAGRGGFVGVGSLYYWASADSPREYRAAMAALRPSKAPESEFPFVVSPAKAAAPAKEPAAWSMAASSTLKRRDDVHAMYAFLEWLEDNGYRAVTCSGTLYVYDPADG